MIYEYNLKLLGKLKNPHDCWKVSLESTYIDFVMNKLHLNSSEADKLVHYFENWWS